MGGALANTPAVTLGLSLIHIFHGDIQQIAKELVAYLRTNGMDFEPGKGYWEDQLYWMVKY